MEAEDAGQHGFSRGQLLDQEQDVVQAANLLVRWDWAGLPRGEVVRSLICHEDQALPLGVGEREDRAATALDDVVMLGTGFAEPVRPPLQRVRTGHGQPDRGNRAGAGPVRRHVWPVEEGHLGAGVADVVPVEEVISGDIVLVDRLLDQPHPEHTGVEFDITRRLPGDGGNVVEAA